MWERPSVKGVAEFEPLLQQGNHPSNQMQEKGSGMIYPTPAACAKDGQDEHGLEDAAA